ncbi:protein MANBAL isoform X1 [Cricetulus griseus]|uniref:Protein MANBAL isoform X1 n=2 Tax=Cricetulus griseus TaxID=10029 RepID=A0A9J7K719_CRIGR|nr:protein MANBAL isoform X1 [Cricetulus griseus]
MGRCSRIWFWRRVTLKRPLAVVTWTMASDLDFSPPEVPEPTFLENLLRYGLFLGAIFQLICVLAIIVPIPKSHEVEAEQSEPRSAEVLKKPKTAIPSTSKRPKKEAKKKR